ncbi:MAG: DUF3007 family protein, partial [Leptolyngbya sp.]|nr:DUF3007 family protein [Leptolyngbya sp.]
LSAGIWSQVLFLGGVLGWVATYLTRVVTTNLTCRQLLQDGEDAVLQKRLEEMSPEALAALQSELAAEAESEEGAPPDSPRAGASDPD